MKRPPLKYVLVALTVIAAVTAASLHLIGVGDAFQIEEVLLTLLAFF